MARVPIPLNEVVLDEVKQTIIRSLKNEGYMCDYRGLKLSVTTWSRILQALNSQSKRKGSIKDFIPIIIEQ